LAWNVNEGFLNTRGNTTITGSRDATREAKGLIQDGAQWMEMIKVETNLHILITKQHTILEIECKLLLRLFVSFEKEKSEF
jgi:hypothetical protein